MKKRALAALLAIMMLLSCIGLPSSAAASTVKQQNVEVQLIDLMKQYCGTYFYQNYYGATQCKGFADMIADKLYGLIGGPGPYSDNRYYLPNAESRGYKSIGILTPGACTAENLRALFLKARPGDYIQCVRYTGTQHSLIVADVHTNGVTFFDCNLKGSYLCASYFYDWEEIASVFTRGFSLYRYSGYQINGDPGLIFIANGGTCSVSFKSLSAGSAFGTLPTPERQGYDFDYWYIISGNSGREPDRIKVNANTVKTSLYDTVLYAHWTKNEGVCGQLGHTWTVDETVRPTCTEDGYTQKRCTVCGKTLITDQKEALGHNWELVPGSTVPATNVEDGSELYHCTRCGSYDTRILRCQLHSFSDIDTDDWFYPYVREMVSYGLMNGTSKTEFSPNGSLTRAMLVTVLWRMEGEPLTMESGFHDVEDGRWYTSAVDWASCDGVINGFPDATFRPDAAITREQAAVILYRYAPVMGRDNEARADLSMFADDYTVSDYAQEAVSWAYATGILSGYPDGTLRPGGQATRAQIAKMIVTFLEKSIYAP